MDDEIAAGKFKAHCLQIMDEVKKKRRRVTITKRNVPVAQIVPIEEEALEPFAGMEGSARMCGDIIEPIDEVWNADH